MSKLQLTDLKSIIKDFDHQGQAAFLIEKLEAAMISGRVKAVPGRPESQKIGGTRFEYRSMVILNTPEFQSWLDEVQAEARNLRFDDSKVASVQNYEDIDMSLFELFAAQAAAELKEHQEETKRKGSKKKTKEETLPETPENIEQEDTEQDAAEPFHIPQAQ